jgi:hypothetical protein
VVLLNIIGIMVSLFCIYVTTDILRIHRLSRSFFFVITALGIFIWNVGHLIHTLLPESYPDIARGVWLVILTGGFIFIISSIAGFTLLKNEYIEWRLIAYTAIFSALMTGFFIKPEWMDIEYTRTEGWVIDPNNLFFWLLFANTIAIIAFIELQLPLILAFFKGPRSNRPSILYLLIGISLALLSNILIPVLQKFDLPIGLSYLIADFGFLLFFYVLDQNPFVGIHDPSTINEVIVTDENEEPIYTLTTDEGKSVLASGAILGINTVLERINLLSENIPKYWTNEFRRIELGFTSYFIALQQGFVLIVNYSGGAGVCIQKFKTLSKIFLNKKLSTSEKLNKFDLDFQLFFPSIIIENRGPFLMNKV